MGGEAQQFVQGAKVHTQLIETLGTTAATIRSLLTTFPVGATVVGGSILAKYDNGGSVTDRVALKVDGNADPVATYAAGTSIDIPVTGFLDLSVKTLTGSDQSAIFQVYYLPFTG